MAGSVVVGVADEELIERVRRGDARAFGELVDRHRAWLTARCRRHLGGDAHAAEDVAQECLVALQRTVTSGDRPMRVRPWLSVVARNRCIDEARKLRAVPTSTIPETAVFDAEVGTEDPHLLRAWSALNGRHRLVLELRELGGFSYEEIAATMAVSAGAVETLLFRARTALRREYARAGGKVAAMAPIEEAVAAAAGHQGVLSRLADGAGGLGADRLSSLVGGAGGGADGAGSSAVASLPSGASPSWLTDAQARLATSPAFEPLVQGATGSGLGGGRLRLVLAGLGALLSTVVVTVPDLSPASTTDPAPPAAPASAPAATVPAAPSTEAPGAPSAEAPPAPAEVEGDVDAGEAPSAPDAPDDGGRVSSVVGGVTSSLPVDPSVPAAPAVDPVAAIADALIEPAIAPLGDVVRLPRRR